MLTAVIRANGRTEALAATLSVLIPAVAGGTIGHAVVIGAGEDSETERLADVTGASYVAARNGASWALGIERARGDWVLLLEAGDLPEPHWAESVERHLMTAATTPALMPLRGIAALREWGAVSLRSRGVRAGLIAPKKQLLSGRLPASPRRLSVRRERAQR
ncbi:glycosyltransferase family A protein [Bosea rubneri]|uniref:Glycosyltransferase family A protein n=1 Tax=Bosea rubneri TaxID=3075434 RepID=A0ABU3S7U2_9HYPH|nr:glycosyltransferase family A protein [Bosea sp. ZW T0_25]MDU0340781.1 glycosyltransferase family A protein [Bosea sp. ZW T0_25]